MIFRSSLIQCTMINVITFILLTSCQEKYQCLEDYLVFDGDYRKSPVITITSESPVANCKYNIEYLFCFQSAIHSIFFNEDGEIYAKDSIFFIQIHKPELVPLPLFDLKKKPGDEYKVELKPITEYDSLQVDDVKVIFENRVMWNHQPVSIFRVKKSFCYIDEFYDVVYFVTVKNGIIGSYISSPHETEGEGTEYYAYPAGNVLEDLIDYSKKREFVLR